MSTAAASETSTATQTQAGTPNHTSVLLAGQYQGTASTNSRPKSDTARRDMDGVLNRWETGRTGGATFYVARHVGVSGAVAGARCNGFSGWRRVRARQGLADEHALPRPGDALPIGFDEGFTAQVVTHGHHRVRKFLRIVARFDDRAVTPVAPAPIHSSTLIWRVPSRHRRPTSGDPPVLRPELQGIEIGYAARTGEIERHVATPDDPRRGEDAHAMPRVEQARAPDRSAGCAGCGDDRR